MASPPPCLPVGPIGQRTSLHYSRNGRAADTAVTFFRARERVDREGVKAWMVSKRREELVVSPHDACVHSRVSEFASSCARSSSVTFRFMTCRRWIFLEAATGGLSRTFVRSNLRPLRATSRLVSDLRYFSGRLLVADENRCSRRDSLERLSQRDRCDSEITPGTMNEYFWVLYQFPEKRFVKPATKPSTVSSALLW